MTKEIDQPMALPLSGRLVLPAVLYIVTNLPPHKVHCALDAIGLLRRQMLGALLRLPVADEDRIMLVCQQSTGRIRAAQSRDPSSGPTVPTRPREARQPDLRPPDQRRALAKQAANANNSEIGGEIILTWIARTWSGRIDSPFLLAIPMRQPPAAREMPTTGGRRAQSPHDRTTPQLHES